MNYSQFKELLERNVHAGQVVLHGKTPESPAYLHLTQWLTAAGYQIIHTHTGYQISPGDVVITLDGNTFPPNGGVLFDLEGTTDRPDGGEVFAFNQAECSWYRKSQEIPDCPWEADAHDFMPELIPELADLFTPEKSCMIYLGANNICPAYKYSFERLCDRILNATLSGKLVFLCNTEETIQLQSFWKAQRAVTYLEGQIPENSVYYVSGGIDAEECVQQALEKSPLLKPIQCLSVVRFDHIAREYAKYQLAEPVYDPITPRSRNYINFNRALRLHRLQLLDKLLAQDPKLTDTTFTSFDLDGKPPAACFTHINAQLDTFPWVLNRTPERENPVTVIQDDIDAYYSNSYFSVISETIFHAHSEGNGTISDAFNSRFLSEKIFKSIVAKHPFIVSGQYQILQALRNQGYQTFHPYIDESYDQIEDDDERMDAIVKEIGRLCEQSVEQWQEWMANVKSIVEYNYKYNQETRSFAVKNSAYYTLLSKLNS